MMWRGLRFCAAIGIYHPALGWSPYRKVLRLAITPGSWAFDGISSHTIGGSHPTLMDDWAWAILTRRDLKGWLGPRVRTLRSLSTWAPASAITSILSIHSRPA